MRYFHFSCNMKLIFVFVLLVLSGGCTKKAASTPETMTADQLVERGKAIYNLNCIACHNIDANKEGAAGPPVYGATRELLEARVLKASYPDGYKPKRDSKLMISMPHVEKEIPALHAYLNSVRQ